MTTMLLAYCTMEMLVYQHESMFGNMHIERVSPILRAKCLLIGFTGNITQRFRIEEHAGGLPSYGSLKV